MLYKNAACPKALQLSLDCQCAGSTGCYSVPNRSAQLTEIPSLISVKIQIKLVLLLTVALTHRNYTKRVNLKMVDQSNIFWENFISFSSLLA